MVKQPKCLMLEKSSMLSSSMMTQLVLVLIFMQVDLQHMDCKRITKLIVCAITSLRVVLFIVVFGKKISNTELGLTITLMVMLLRPSILMVKSLAMQ